jgi:type IV pilus assembly protein PilA
MRRAFDRKNGAFTLIEVLLVVAIIGILASIAIPNFLRYQLRARSSEAVTNIAAIALTQKTYFAENGNYVDSAAPIPLAIPGNNRASWTSNPAFSQLGWEPEGGIFFQYLISADALGRGRFTIEAAGDLDDNAVPSFFGYVRPSGGSGIDGRLPGSTCSGTGVYSPSTGTTVAIDSAGPCDGQAGNSIF